jgi:hypothetical protein
MSHLGVARDLRAGLLQSGVNVELITLLLAILE